VGELGRLLLQGAVRLGVCAIVALCMVGFLSLLAKSTVQKGEERRSGAALCKARYCAARTKGGGPMLAASKAEKGSGQ